MKATLPRIIDVFDSIISSWPFLLASAGLCFWAFIECVAGLIAAPDVAAFWPFAAGILASSLGFGTSVGIMLVKLLFETHQ